MSDESLVIISANDLLRRAKDVARVAVNQCDEGDGKHAILLISTTVLLAAAAILIKTGQLDHNAMHSLLHELLDSFELDPSEDAANDAKDVN